MTAIKKILGDAFSLKDDTTSQDEIYNRLVNSATIRGTNMCVLILAILIASIGLNMNSTAVIIGAMLISPLMGSIMAIAYGIASGDLKIVRRFFIGFAFQIVVSLLTSTLYFSITPISDSTSELLARTQPTIWDVLIAVFGGLAGIIGMTRKEKSNVIPGVAIATALMPPLCTAGYGLATRQWSYFFGAFYLFTLNSYFICLSSIIVLLLLKVPRHTIMEQKVKKKVLIRVTISTILLMIPSILIAVNMIGKSDITGFEEEKTAELSELGKEAEILFPQIENISLGNVDSYHEGEITSSSKLSVILSEPVSDEREKTMRQWLAVKCEDAEEIEIIVQNEKT
ncbi:TIGR00341 family protein [Porcipelethomonas sp.]|uniref:TIGR00341 family protein n=1 Tax=Porcipelethomonas sp. TaxID=2981675 RepID=UPI003EF489AA